MWLPGRHRTARPRVRCPRSTSFTVRAPVCAEGRASGGVGKPAVHFSTGGNDRHERVRPSVALRHRGSSGHAPRLLSETPMAGLRRVFGSPCHPSILSRACVWCCGAAVVAAAASTTLSPLSCVALWRLPRRHPRAVHARRPGRVLGCAPVHLQRPGIAGGVCWTSRGARGTQQSPCAWWWPTWRN
jgi:hypothetical protein